MFQAKEFTQPLLVVVFLGTVSLAEAQQKVKDGQWWNEPESNGPGAELDEILGPGAESRWELPSPTPQLRYEVQRDESLGRKVLALEGPQQLVLKGRTVYGSGIEVTCRVRLAGTDAAKTVYFILNLAKKIDVPQDQGIRIFVSGRTDDHLIGFQAHIPPKPFYQSFNLKPYPTISPILAESVRLPLEKDMAAAPEVKDKWVTLRAQIMQDRVRVWLDDRLAFDAQETDLKTLRVEQRAKELAAINALEDEQTRTARLKAFNEQKLDPKVIPTSGHIQATLTAGAQLAEISVRTLPRLSGLYESIAVDGYANERRLLGRGETSVDEDALPFGREVLVQGIPFRFVDRSATGGPDHLDISRSLCRQGNMEGYFPSSTPRLGGAFFRDPARIQLRVPNGRYDALYAIAAFDEEENRIPLLSAAFYRPSAGFGKVFETEVPSYRAKDSEGTALPVRLENGRKANLWLVKIPLSPEAMASFSDLDALDLELTKKVRQHRSYPDPYIYGWHQGGRPSGVHVYAVTLHRPEVHFSIEPTIFGNVWMAGRPPSYNAQLSNRSGETRTVELIARTLSYDESERTEQTKSVTLNPGADLRHRFVFSVKRFGLHTLRVTMKDGETVWTEERHFAHLAPDTRAVRYEEGKGPMFGYWSYFGGHYTAPGKEQLRLMTLAGARGTISKPPLDEETLKNIWERHNYQHGPHAWPINPQWGWAGEENLDLEKYQEYSKAAVEAIRKVQGEQPPAVSFYPEPHLSQRLTAGNIPDYWGEKPFEYTEHERRAIRVFFNTSKSAAEGVRKEWPNTKILIPWGDPLFIWPILRAGYPKDLIDGSGLDMIGFERLPEQQLHQASTHRLYMVKEEYRKAGIENPFLPYIEGTFVPTEPGACTWNEQADLYHRWALISLAYGITHFYSGWSAWDAGSYYGAEHYAGCGLFRRIPYNDPKPAYTHYATMTRMLDRTKFDRWLPTGSLTTYCLKFARETGGPVYALWTVRGKRPATLKLAADATVTVQDSMDNGTAIPSKDATVTVPTGTSPIYVNGAGDIVSVQVGEPDNSDAIEWARTRNQETWHTGPVYYSPFNRKELKIASLGDGTWRIDPDERDELYETNNYDTMRYHGKMTDRVVTDAGRTGSHLAIHLEKQDTEHQLMPWYTVVRPRRPVTIPGRAVQLRLWVKASSDWGRVVYSLRDAKGERWISIGTKDEWNCNDVHSWGSLNFDGWRLLHFELPSHAPYDSYREYGTTWWRKAGGDSVVDLPLSIEKIIIERRTHVLYVNDIQPANPADALLSDLFSVYETDFDATPEAVKRSRIRMKLPEAPKTLPNPIQEMTRQNALSPTKLLGVKDPDWGYDGTRCHVHFEEVADAGQYQIWVAAHEDGRGAQLMARMTKSGELLQGLRPYTTFYLWTTYTDKGQGKDQKQSKPSNILPIYLIDAFGQK